MTLSLFLAAFFRPNSFFTFYCLQHHVHIRHRRDYDEQKAVVVVKHHYQGYLFNTKHASSEAQVTYVQMLLRIKGSLH